MTLVSRQFTLSSILVTILITLFSKGMVAQDLNSAKVNVTKSDPQEGKSYHSNGAPTTDSRTILQSNSLVSRERMLRDRSEKFKAQHKKVWDQVRQSHDRLSDSRAKQIALNVASELLRSLESVYLKSAVNVEKEWICWSRNMSVEHVQEYKFQLIQSYETSDSLLDTANLVLEYIESKVGLL